MTPALLPVLALAIPHPGDALAALYACGLAVLAGAAGLRIGMRRVHAPGGAPRADGLWLLPLVLLPLAAGVVVYLQAALIWSAILPLPLPIVL